jgi:hypothetical protein
MLLLLIVKILNHEHLFYTYSSTSHMSCCIQIQKCHAWVKCFYPARVTHSIEKMTFVAIQDAFVSQHENDSLNVAQIFFPPQNLFLVE